MLAQTLAPEFEEAIEDVVAAGFREQVLASYLATVPLAGGVQ